MFNIFSKKSKEKNVSNLDEEIVFSDSKGDRMCISAMSSGNTRLLSVKNLTKKTDMILDEDRIKFLSIIFKDFMKNNNISHSILTIKGDN